MDFICFRQGLSCGMRVHHVSPIVSVKPHGIQFHDQFPALLVIPIAVEPQEEKWLSCLCSNTPEGHTPDWKHLPQNSYTYRFDFHIYIKVCFYICSFMFSKLFTRTAMFA